MKSLFKTISLITIFTVITRLLGFVFRIFLSRTISAEDLGAYQISFSIFAVLLTIVSSGLPLIISRATATFVQHKNKLDEQKITTAGVVISVVLSVALSLIVIAISPLLKILLTDKRCVELLIILLPALVFSAIYSSIRGNMWGKNDFMSVCITELFEQVVRILCFVLLSFLLFKGLDGAVSSAISLTISCVLSSILVVVLYVCKGGKFKRTKDKKIYKSLIKQTAPITGVRLLTSLISPIIALIIPARLISAGYTSSQAVSLYGIISGMTFPLLFVPSTLIGSLSMALVPDLSFAYSKQDHEYIQNRIQTSLKFTVFISCLFIPLYFGLGEFVGKFFYNNIQSGILLSASSWVILPMELTNITSSILNSVGMETKQFKNYLVGGITMLLFIWFLPKYLGINALIYGFGACFTISAILNLFMLKKHLKINLNLKKNLLYQLLLIIPTASVSYFVGGILNHFVNLFFTLAIACSIGAVFYILSCVCFGLIDIKTIFIELKNKKKHKHA